MTSKLNTNARKAEIRGMKKFLSKEIIEDTFTAADQAYQDLWLTENIEQIGKLQAYLETVLQENARLKDIFNEKDKKFSEQITVLRNAVNKKCNDIMTLTERNHELIKSRNLDLADFAKKLDAENNNFAKMHEKFGCEIKQLNSKLNNLEEFRLQRESLIETHNNMQSQLKALEERAEGIVKVYHRVDLINKHRMGQELKDKLLKLSIEFQESSQTETTRSLIRENIAINNELGGHIGSWHAHYDENRMLKKQKNIMQINLLNEEMLEGKCVSLNVLQTLVIERLAHEHTKLNTYHDVTESLKNQIQGLENKLEEVSLVADKEEKVVRLLTQTKHVLITQINNLKHEFRTISNANHNNEVALKKSLLHVAEGQELIFKQRHGRISKKDLLIKLKELIDSIEQLFPYEKVQSVAEQESLQGTSEITIYDPNYSKRYWRGQTSTDLTTDLLKSDLDKLVVKEDEDGDSDSDDSQ